MRVEGRQLKGVIIDSVQSIQIAALLGIYRQEFRGPRGIDPDCSSGAEFVDSYSAFKFFERPHVLPDVGPFFSPEIRPGIRRQFKQKLCGSERGFPGSIGRTRHDTRSADSSSGFSFRSLDSFFNDPCMTGNLVFSFIRRSAAVAAGCGLSMLLGSCGSRMNDARPAGGSRRADPLSVSGVIAVAAPLENVVRSSGTVMASESVDLVAESAGRVETIAFTEGGHVRKGRAPREDQRRRSPGAAQENRPPDTARLGPGSSPAALFRRTPSAASRTISP